MNKEQLLKMPPWKRFLLEAALRVPHALGVRVLSGLLGCSLVQRLLFGGRKRSLRRLIATIHSPADEHAAMTRHLLSNLALPWLVSNVSRCDEEELRRHVHVENEALLAQARAKGKGVLVVGCHTGVSRLVPWWLMKHGHTVAAMEPEPWLRKMHARDAERVKSIVMRGEGEQFWLRQIFQARKELAAGSTVHVAMDGLQGTGGESRDFLGRARVFHVGLVLVALSMSVPVVEALTEIDEQGRMNVRFLDPLEDADEEMALEEKGKRFLNNYTASLERFWVENPGNVQIHHLRHYLNLASAPQAGPTDAGNPQGKEQASA